MPPFSISPFSHDALFDGLSNVLLPPAMVQKQCSPQYLAGYLGTLEAKTIIVESDYTDGDYLDDFASYYVKCYHSYNRRCRRLHFFNAAYSEAQFRSLILGETDTATLEAFQNAYLGFIVARPLPDAIIGRTVLKTYADDGGRRQYCCVKYYRANLFGINLGLWSLAFQEQDSVLAACATVSLWSAFHKLADLFGTPVPTPVEITRVANQVALPSRPVPSRSLSLQQICNSIRHVGLEPEVVQIGPDTPLVSLAYGHLAVGLPVILLIDVEGMGGHAITLVGYSMLPKQVRESDVAAGTTSIPLAGLRIDKFYAHDDQFGPFEKLVIQGAGENDGKEYHVTFEGDWFDHKQDESITLYPKVAIVPVYHKIRLTYLEVMQILTGAHALAKMILGAPINPGDIEWNVHLTTTNYFKDSVKSWGISKIRMEELLLLQHPRFIWYAGLAFGNAVVLDLLIDATDMARSFPIYRAIWRDATVHSAAMQILNEPGNQAILSEMLGPKLADFLKNAPAPDA